MAQFKMGLTLDTMVNIEELDVPLPVPRAPFEPYAKEVTAASGKSIGKGFGSFLWIFSVLKPLQREQLRVFCPAPKTSSVVYVQTMVNEKDEANGIAADSYQIFKVIMHWPRGEKRDASAVHARLEHTFRFSHIEPVA